jgi:hypothetical protein
MVPNRNSTVRVVVPAIVAAVAIAGLVAFVVASERRIGRLETELHRARAAPEQTSEAPAAASPSPSFALPAVVAPAQARTDPGENDEGQRLSRLEATVVRLQVENQQLKATIPASALPAQPKTDAMRSFVEQFKVSDLQWRTLTQLNRYWTEVLEKAEREGDAKSLDAFIAARERKLSNTLGDPEAVKQYLESEQRLPVTRTWRGRDGKVYQSHEIE